MKTTEVALNKLATRLASRAIDINAGHAYQGEDPAVRRAMKLILQELAEMMREESRALSKDSLPCSK